MYRRCKLARNAITIVFHRCNKLPQRKTYFHHAKKNLVESGMYFEYKRRLCSAMPLVGENSFRLFPTPGTPTSKTASFIHF